MKNTNQWAQLAVTAILTAGMGLGASTAIAADAPQKMEKCYGIVKAEMNECGNAEHPCQGQAKTDGAFNEWIYVPEGTCEKIVGGKKTSS